MDTALDAWFADEILVHEAALVHYLRRVWAHIDDVHDLRQEIYVRVYEAAGRARPHQPRPHHPPSPRSTSSRSPPAWSRGRSSANVGAMDTALDAWFADEILVHEAALVHYLRRVWAHIDDVHDLRQEIYVRVYEAAGRARPHQPKSFLFATARHLMTDRLRRGRVVSIEPVGDFESLNVLVDEVTPERRLGARQNLRRLADAFDLLPGRCREVVWLRRVEELPQKEVAARMGITEKTVEKQVAKGMRLLAEHYYGATQSLADDAQDADRNREHGRKQTD